MQFILIAYDGTDEQAIDRRVAARENHLSFAKKMYDSGRWLYAAAILDDTKKMIGSMIVCDFESREELEKEWLDKEAYITGNVWEKIDIKPAQVAPFCLK